MDRENRIDPEDIGVNTSTAPKMADIIAARLSRRGLLQGVAATAALAGVPETALAQARAGVSSLTFAEVPQGLDDTHHVAAGYKAQILIRWGDKVVKGAPEFDVRNQTAAAQQKQFGYNNDFLAFMPLPAGSRNSEHGLLCVNHEYTNTELMFPGFTQPHNGKSTLR